MESIAIAVGLAVFLLGGITLVVLVHLLERHRERAQELLIVLVNRLADKVERLEAERDEDARQWDTGWTEHNDLIGGRAP